MSTLNALVLNCTLKPAPTVSSTEAISEEIVEALAKHDVSAEIVRVVDQRVKFGVQPDEGDGDGWPGVRRKMLDADIVVLATPIWLGQPSAVCKMTLERLNAELGESDDQGRLLTYDKVAGVAVVGNEDGAHHVSAELYQGLNDCGFTLPANAVTYWVGEAMQGTDYKDNDPRPEKTQQTTATLAANLAHVARLLKERPLPAS
jgi:multimeric flavodoxin WrbA